MGKVALLFNCTELILIWTTKSWLEARKAFVSPRNSSTSSQKLLVEQPGPDKIERAYADFNLTHEAVVPFWKTLSSHLTFLHCVLAYHLYHFFYSRPAARGSFTVTGFSSACDSSNCCSDMLLFSASELDVCIKKFQHSSQSSLSPVPAHLPSLLWIPPSCSRCFSAQTQVRKMDVV